MDIVEEVSSFAEKRAFYSLNYCKIIKSYTRNEIIEAEYLYKRELCTELVSCHLKVN